MMQSHILPLQPPYNIIYCRGYLGRHIATLITVEELTHKDGQPGGIRTCSHPIVSYEAARKRWEEGCRPLPAYMAASEGIVWDQFDLSACYNLCQEDAKQVGWSAIAVIIEDLINRTQPNESDLHYLFKIENQLLQFGIQADVSQVEEEVKVRIVNGKDRFIFFVDGHPLTNPFPFYIPRLEELRNEDIDAWTDKEESLLFNQMIAYHNYFNYKKKRLCFSFDEQGSATILQELCQRLNKLQDGW